MFYYIVVTSKEGYARICKAVVEGWGMGTHSEERETQGLTPRILIKYYTSLKEFILVFGQNN